LALVTLGFGLIVQYLIRNLDPITEGTKGMNPIEPGPVPGFTGQNITSLRLLEDWGTQWYDYPYLYFVALGLLAVAMLFLRNLERSPLGRAWVSLREDELVAEEPKPKMKPKKKKLESESDDDDDDEELKPKSKKKRPKKAKRDDDEDRPQKMYSDDEGENVLGPRKQVFTPGIDTLRIVAIICGVLAALGLLSCILSTVTKMPDSAIPFAIVAFVGGMGGLFWSMKSLTFQVVVHAGGIVHSHRGSSKIIPWEEIVRVTEGITADNQKVGQKGITDAYLIELTDHTRISYTNKIIKDVKKLGKIIIEKTSAAIFPQVRVKYDRGDMYDFGRLGINHSGLHYRKQVLKWKEIQGLKITDGYLTVNRQGKWVRWHDIEASAIPNLHVFLTFANEVVLSHAE